MALKKREFTPESGNVDTYSNDIIEFRAPRADMWNELPCI